MKLNLAKFKPSPKLSLRKYNAKLPTKTEIKISESKTTPEAKKHWPPDLSHQTAYLERERKEKEIHSRPALKLKLKIKLPTAQKIKINQPLIPIPERKQIIAQESAKAVENNTSIDKSVTAFRNEMDKNKSIQLTKLTGQKLIADDFVADDSQIAAVELMTKEKFMCMIGAAGTGKTTVTKLGIDSLIHTIRAIDVSGYWKPAFNDKGERVKQEHYIPSICLVAFTGQAMQMIRKNFPKSWHGNIMTIHRMLGYVPESYEDFDEEGNIVKKRRFVPSFGRAVNGALLPWDIIIIDEAGMVSVDLWSKIYDALKPTTQVKLIGDINQLPPVHGKSILGHAMIKWPVAELTTIHRQKGVKNPIVENAWNILHGKSPVNYPKFNIFPLPSNIGAAQNMVRQVYKGFRQKGLLDPDKDVIITPINGDKISDGAPLGQIPLNDILAAVDLKDYKKDHDKRWLINAGREKKPFAVGDRVMVTKNDHTIGITNGMMGEIVEIEENDKYTGDRSGYGILNLKPNELPQDHIAGNEGFKLDIEAFLENSADFMAKSKEQMEAERGSASHTVTVRFGEPLKDTLIIEERADGSTKETVIEEEIDESAKPLFVKFSTFAEICSLQLSYAITCHKAQGAEFHTVIIILHTIHSKMLYREWLYTAVTRAVDRVILLHTEAALAKALANQRITGGTLKEKIRSFRLIAKLDESKVPPMGNAETLIFIDEKEESDE